LPPANANTEPRRFKNDVGQAADDVERLAFLDDRLFEAEIAEGMRPPRNREPAQQDFGRRFDEDQADGSNFLLELLEELGEPLNHASGADIQNHDQPIHFPFGAVEELLHQVEWDVVDAHVAYVFEAAAEN
jgi:hypothetical protein